MAGANILDHFKGDELATIQKACPLKELAVEEFLCQFGEPAKEMFIIISGQVEVLRPRRRQGEFDKVGVLGAGEITGEAALMGVFPRSASLRALEPVTIMVVTRERLAKLKKENPALLMELYQGIFEQLGERFLSLVEKKTPGLF
ncbi:MAG: cyclic nucleotide-binding domain-containing protein [Candidatus Hydrogenedentota bacterium]